MRLVPRGDTTVVDAYLSPILRRYVDQVTAELNGVRVYFMQTIFGPAADQPVDAAAVRTKFADLAEEVGRATGESRDPRAVAEGFLRIAVGNMANAIKQVSVQKGHDVTRFTLQCFGGAGGQHACPVADALGMATVFIHPYAGVLSPSGVALADQTVM